MMMARSASGHHAPPPTVTWPLWPTLMGSPPFLEKAKGTGNLAGDRWASQERRPWGPWAEDQG